MSDTDGLLFNPHTEDFARFDPETRRLLLATVEWFESRGKNQLLHDDLEAVWVSDFLDFVKKEKLFATFQTPAAYADGDENRRWDGARNAALVRSSAFTDSRTGTRGRSRSSDSDRSG